MNVECEVQIAVLRRALTDRRGARGMTLFEILLVLVLLVVLGSLATPLLDSTFSSMRLRRGTDQVLAAWSEARTKAIEHGQIYQFRFSEESNKYRVDRWYADESQRAKKASSTATSSLEGSEEKPDWHTQAALSETVFFVGGEQAGVDTAGSREVETLAGEKNAAWSAPIFFFPDGTTSEASLLLRNEKERYQRATLRALTGIARASKLLSAEEVEEQKSL